VVPKCLIQIGAGVRTLRHYNLVPKCPGAEVSREHWLRPARDPACKNWRPPKKGGRVGVWVKLSPCMLFSPFFGFLNKGTAHPESVGLTLNAPKDVFPRGVIFPQGYVFPDFTPKNRKNLGAWIGISSQIYNKFKSPYLQNYASDWLKIWQADATYHRGFVGSLIWTYNNSKMADGHHHEFWKITVSQPPIEILARNFVWWLRSTVESRLYVKNCNQK